MKNLILETLQTESVKKGVVRALRTINTDNSFIAALDENADPMKAGMKALRQLFEGKNLEELAELLPEALHAVSMQWDELTEILVMGSLEPDADGIYPNVFFEDMTMGDVTKLRDAVNAQNNWAEIWGMEKNSMVAVFGKMLNLSVATESETNSNQDGGPVGIPSSLVTDSV